MVCIPSRTARQARRSSSPGALDSYTLWIPCAAKASRTSGRFAPSVPRPAAGLTIRHVDGINGCLRLYLSLCATAPTARDPAAPRHGELTAEECSNTSDKRGKLSGRQERCLVNARFLSASRGLALVVIILIFIEISVSHADLAFVRVHAALEVLLIASRNYTSTRRNLQNGPSRLGRSRLPVDPQIVHSLNPGSETELRLNVPGIEILDTCHCRARCGSVIGVNQSRVTQRFDLHLDNAYGAGRRCPGACVRSAPAQGARVDTCAKGARNRINTGGQWRAPIRPWVRRGARGGTTEGDDGRGDRYPF